MRIFRILLVGAIILIPVHVAVRAAATDFGSCQDDLDRLRKVAAEASRAAGDAQSKMEDFDECKSDPGTFDLMHDRCRSAQSDYESAAGDLEGKMDDVDRRLRDVQSSCGYEFSANKLSSAEAAARHLEGAKQRMCLSYKHLVSLLSRQNALQMCQAQQSVEWCNACLGP
jgi:hypothetical protein